MLAAITALIPLFVALLNLFASKKLTDAEKVALAEEIKQNTLNQIARIRAAIDHATDTGGDTSRVEEIINKRPKK